MIYNRAWLKATIASYLHDGTLAAELDTFIDMGALRIAETLQCAELESELTRSVGDADSFMAMDSTVKRVLGVQWQSNSGAYINLRSVPRHEAGRYKRSGQPCVYLIQDRNIYPLPFVDGNYKAQVMSAASVPEDDQAVNAVLSAYPFLFLNAALAEAYDWKQDVELMSRYESKWANEADAITSRWNSERIGDTPAQRAM